MVWYRLGFCIVAAVSKFVIIIGKRMKGYRSNPLTFKVTEKVQREEPETD